jgi:hypothetical protein
MAHDERSEVQGPRRKAKGLNKKMSKAKYQISNQILISEVWVSALVSDFRKINHGIDQGSNRDLKEKISGNIPVF